MISLILDLKVWWSFTSVIEIKGYEGCSFGQGSAWFEDRSPKPLPRVGSFGIVMQESEWINMFGQI